MDELLFNIPKEISTLVELLRWRAQHQPDQPAYTFLLDGETKTVSWTYQELDQQARIIGSLLQQAQATGERVLLLYPSGLEYIAGFFGCLYAGAVAVPAYFPHSVHSVPRIQTIVQDAQAKVALTTSQLLISKDRWSSAPILQNLRWFAVDEISAPLELENNWQSPTIARDTLAFLQYTSGSTFAPKGVMVSHGNLLHNMAQLQQSVEAVPNKDHMVSWLPPYHDMGLIAGILYPLSMGIPATLMAAVAFLQRPQRWLEAISRTHATISIAPNFAYELCVDKTTVEKRATLDLSSLAIAINGSEPVRKETLERFTATFAPCGFRGEAFYPAYGLAEATLIVSGGKKSASPVVRVFQSTALEQNSIITSPEMREDTRSLVGCGQALLDQSIYIVDPQTCTLCPSDQIGEIWVAGPSVAQGYWNRSEETKQTFQAYLADTQEGPFLRTGDLGFFHDGELFIAGREKDLIIIRGRNYHPQDIEQTAEQSHHALRRGCCAAFSVDVAGRERLVIVQELGRHHENVDSDTVAKAIRQAVAEAHELYVYAVVLIKTATIPKTTSGKIQRSACRAAYLEGTLTIIGISILEEELEVGQEEFEVEQEETISYATLLASEPEERQRLIEAYLRKLVTKILPGFSSSSLLDPQESLSLFGFDSVMSVDLAMCIETDLEIVMPLEVILQGPSLAQLGANILTRMDEAVSISSAPALVKAAEPLVKYPLSFAQQAMWYGDQVVQLRSEHALYNIPLAIRMTGVLDPSSLEQSLNEIVSRHAILRATFAMVKWYPIQIIAPTMKIHLAVEDLTYLLESEREAEAQRLTSEEGREPFDPSEDPLFRAKLLHLSDEDHLLLLTLHHVVFDGWCVGILLQELMELYQAYIAGAPSPLPALPIEYTDFVLWEQEWLERSIIEKQLEYWKRKLHGAPTILQLPTDHPRPLVQTYQGAAHFFVIPRKLTAALKEFSRQEGCSLFTTLLATFSLLLYSYTGQEDILISSPFASRTRKEFKDLIGNFVKLLVLRIDLSGQPAFQTILQRVRKTALEAYAHPDFPLAMLLETLQPKWDVSRALLVQVMFVLHNFPMPPLELPGLTLRLQDTHSGTSKFDLALSMMEIEQELHATLEYNSVIFDTARIQRMMEQFQALLEMIVANPKLQLSDVSLLTEKNSNYVQLRGVDIDLGEIEATLRRHPAVQDAMVCLRERRLDDKGLVAYVVLKQGPVPTNTDLCRYLLKQLPYYMVPPAFVMLDAFPPMSGRDNDALPDPDWESYELSSTTVVSRSTPEALLAESGTELIGVAQVNEHESFFEAGEQLLLGAQLIEQFRSRFPMGALPRWIPKGSVIAAGIDRIHQRQLGPLRTFSRVEDVPLSSAQQRLWQLNQLKLSPDPYTISLTMRLSGHLKLVSLEQSFHEIVYRHEILRTTFADTGQYPHQIIGAVGRRALSIIDLRHYSESEKGSELHRLISEESLRPFDLTQEPPWRAVLIQLSQEEAVLSIAMHRIISDDWSLRIFMRELAIHYHAFAAGKRPLLPELSIQYADFIYWQREYLKGEGLKQQLAYWKQQLRGASTMLKPPHERGRLMTQTPRSAKCSLSFPKILIDELKELSRREGATLFMTLLTAFGAMLHHYTGQNDLVIGTPISGRSQQELKGMIGPFASMIALRMYVADYLSFRGLLGQVRSVVWGAQNHQEVPFEHLIEVLQPNQLQSNTPLCQVMFALQDTPLPALASAGLSWSPLEVDKQLALLDLTLTMTHTQNELVGTLEYNADIFDASMSMSLLEDLQALLERVVTDPQSGILNRDRSNKRVEESLF